MRATPSDFEAIGSRLGFRVAAETPERLVMVWRVPRFPALLCLGMALALALISAPIVEAIRQRGFAGPAASLWYFPVMNVILLGIAAYLLSIKRLIAVDRAARAVTLTRRSLFRTFTLRLSYDEIAALRLGTDRVYSGFALAGSSAAETYPVASLRLELKSGETVLLDRGGQKRLESFGEHVAKLIEKRVERESGDGTSDDAITTPSDTAPGAVA